MHLRLSMTNGATIASVGQAGMQRTHSPQVFFRGGSGLRSRSVTTSARNTHEP